MSKTPPLPTLPMQLMLSLGCWLSSPFALACAKSAWPSLKINAGDPKATAALQHAIAAEGKNRAESLLKGVLRYYDTPYARNAQEAPCVWRRGNARLLDYGVDSGQWTVDGKRSPSTVNRQLSTVLFIPSLINRYYILDLEQRSMLRYMAAQGLYPLVLDWGEPGAFEQSFGCSDYITGILKPAVDFISHAANRPIILAGYCMGGNMALAAAQLKRRQVSALALMATPWNFHCSEFLSFVVDRQWLPMIEAAIAKRKNLSADIIQSLFYMTDPFVFEHKFRRFAGLASESQEAKEFIALERWVNDGVPMTANMARDCLIGWAQENQLHSGRWTVDGTKIDPGKLKLPTLIAMPENDHVVPRDCALPLAEAMPHAQVIHPSAGHVGMIIGSQAKKELWQKLAEWTQAISA